MVPEVLLQESARQVPVFQAQEAEKQVAKPQEHTVEKTAYFNKQVFGESEHWDQCASQSSRNR